MSVEARFYVHEVGQVHGGAGKVVMLATTKGDYQSWSKYTPSGRIEFTCLNDAATDFFRERLGKDIAVTFTDPPPEAKVE